MDEHRTKVGQEVIEEIEKAITELKGLMASNLISQDVPRLKTGIENLKNAAMKIGKAMYQGSQGG